MVIKLLDGAPRSWPSNGFPPLRSARNPAATPDRDIAEDLRKQLNKNILDPVALSSEQSQQIAALMLKDFGSPAEPRVRVPDWNEIAKQGVRADWEAAKAAKDELKLDDASLARGSVVYRRWCMQCHGVTGAGNGAQAIELAAMPRDYRQGIFKFVTAFVKPDPKQPKKGLGPSGKPLRADLVRTIRKGIDGSMMPAFPTLTDAEVEDLVSYVIHLAVRGETEFATMAKAMQPTEEDPDFTGPELVWLFNQNLMFVLINWQLAAKSPIPIPPENVRSDDDRLLSAFRGYKNYTSAEFGCAACHVDFGREPQLKWDMWGGVVQPRNLPLGVYRGGRTGKDLYARLYGGIYPSGMTAFHTALATGPSYFDKPDKLWNVVHFLEALSDPYARQQLQNPATLAKFKEQLKAQGDLSLDDLNGVKLEP
jgi:mono/diheme cytochrome c family protein